MSTGDTYDVIVVGSGGGGLVGAYVAASRGLRTLLIEKTDRVGGTTAYSGAGIWFPGAAPIARAGAEDDIEAARAYLRYVVADDDRVPLQDAYLDAGPKLIDELEQSPWFQSFTYDPVPDYYTDAPGATAGGRTIFPPRIAVAELGDHAALVRDSIPVERLGAERGPVFDGGRALIGRALAAFLETGNGTLRTQTRLTDLVVEDGRVVGVTADSAAGQAEFRAARGVLLAAGGFERDAELRREHHTLPLDGSWSNGAPGNTGDALRAGVAVGAATELLDEAWFVPGLVHPDGLPVFHTATRSGIWVNAAGERFVNENRPYDQTGHELIRLHSSTDVSHIPTHWILDQRQIDRDGFGGSPDEPVRPEWLESGALKKADSLEELAELIGVPYGALAKTVEEFNGYARTGVDERFHRGETPWDRMYSFIVGFPAGPVMNYLIQPVPEAPNPLLLPLDTPPYYAATIVLSDIGTKGGLKTDEHARVLRPDGAAVPGLYAAGNTAAAMSGHVYPGAGTPIGSSLAFSYRAVLDMAAGTPD
ncbi:FAD-dependent oxidoreductase [Streptomyces sp. NPDC023723]|uniref:FAD-dependent oxidoreductase n=1 Tax=Streptomyces sp. NPDC023723 TaxID=3154323 RepID=UPI0034046237